MTPHFVVSHTDDASSVIFDRNMFMIQAYVEPCVMGDADYFMCSGQCLVNSADRNKNAGQNFPNNVCWAIHARLC